MRLNLRLRPAFLPACVLAVLLAAACTEDPDYSSLPFLDRKDSVRTESFGVTYYFSDSARVVARMQARHVAERTENNDRQAMEVVYVVDGGLVLYFLDAGGQTVSTVTADAGEVQRSSERATLRGNVRLASRRGETLETEELHWDQRKDSIFTQKRVRIQTPDQLIIGRKGMRANASFTSYTVFDIQGEIESEGTTW
ncbi:MAG: LPS export ABC transporter periplasmic protein LptC [Bacteroidia bacterium]|nr:LPS export ABC transporter periplasmic protein LptC [Bacteroidia bacterium]